MNSPGTQHSAPGTQHSALDQIRLLGRAIAQTDPGETREALIARRDKLIASRMTPLLVGRPRGLVAPIRQPEARR